MITSGRICLELDGKLTTVLELLFEKGADVNCKDKRGRTALHICCAESVESAIETLLNQPKVDVNAQDEAGNTPLHYLIKDWYFTLAQVYI